MRMREKAVGITRTDIKTDGEKNLSVNVNLIVNMFLDLFGYYE